MISSMPSDMCINIGCGMTPTIGWINFDNSTSVKLARHIFLCKILYNLKILNENQWSYIRFCQKSDIKWANAVRRIPAPDGAVSVIYTSHMLEHLDQAEATSFLSEALRVLKPGGVIRIAVPDIRAHVLAYMETGDANSFIAGLRVCMPRPKGILNKLREAFIGHRNHLWMYDGPSLCKLLAEQGFAGPKILSAGETTILQPGKLNLRERAEISVYVEAVRI